MEGLKKKSWNFPSLAGWGQTGIFFPQLNAYIVIKMDEFNFFCSNLPACGGLAAWGQTYDGKFQLFFLKPSLMH